MMYQRPEIRVQIFKTEDYLSVSSILEEDDTLPGDPDQGHTIITDAFGEVLNEIFKF